MDNKIRSSVERLLESEVAKAREQNTNLGQVKERIAITDQKALLGLDLRRILMGEVEVYDPRQIGVADCSPNPDTPTTDQLVQDSNGVRVVLSFLLPGQETSRDPDNTRRKEVLVSDIGDFEGQWNAAVEALEKRYQGTPSSTSVKMRKSVSWTRKQKLLVYGIICR